MTSKIAVVGERYHSILNNALSEYGLKCLPMPENPCVDRRLASHVDLSLFYTGVCLVAAPYLRGSEFIKRLSKHVSEIVFAEIEQGSAYPFDAALNAKLFGNNLIFSRCITADEVLYAARRKSGESPELINVNQGYASCSVCAVTDSAVITADAGIAHALDDTDVEVLRVSPGGIKLDGYGYGFIGGASIKLPPHTLLFTGRLDDHPEKDLILHFAEAHGTEVSYLTDLPAFDIGGAVII